MAEVQKSAKLGGFIGSPILTYTRLACFGVILALHQETVATNGSLSLSLSLNVCIYIYIIYIYVHQQA